jgi:hypothetical protein
VANRARNIGMMGGRDAGEESGIADVGREPAQAAHASQ